MLSQTVYRSKFTIDEFKNFFISNFLIKNLNFTSNFPKLTNFIIIKKPYILVCSDKTSI